MKKTTIIPILALLAASCGGGNNTQTQGGNATDTVNNAAPQPVAYKYVEPKDTIAKTIWNAIKTEEPEVAKNIALAVKLNHMPQSKAENYKSKTYLEYLYEIPNEDCHDNPLYARYHMQCYQTLDSSWIAVIDELVHGEKLKGEKISRYFTAHYKDGKITFPPNTDYFPKGYQTPQRTPARPALRPWQIVTQPTIHIKNAGQSINAFTDCPA